MQLIIYWVILLYCWQEPIGHLLLAIQRIVVGMESQEEVLSDENVLLVKKFNNILTSLTKRFIRCDLNHFELVSMFKIFYISLALIVFMKFLLCLRKYKTFSKV